MEVDEEEGTVSFPAASPERPHATPWTEDEKPGNESYESYVEWCWGKCPPIDDDVLRAMWKEWRRQMKEEKEKEEKEKEEKFALSNLGLKKSEMFFRRAVAPL